MDSSGGEQASSSPKSVGMSVSNLVSEPMLDIDSATLELSLPEDAVRPNLQHIDSVQSHDWEDVDKFETFTDFDSITDSFTSNRNSPKQIDFPYLGDGNGFQGSDNSPSDISKDDRLGQLVRNVQNKGILTSQELELVNSVKEKLEFKKNSNDTKSSANSSFSEKDNEASNFQPVSDGCENVPLEGAVNIIQSEEMKKSLEAHPEYTENFHNYKVCRVIAPGVKECLILETGEQVKCDKRKKLKEIEENLRKSTLKNQDSSSIENPSIVTVVPTEPPPSLPPTDNADHSAPNLEPKSPNKSEASASSDKENVHSEVCMSPPLRKKDKNCEKSPGHIPLREKQVMINSCDEDGADSGPDKLSKKVFKITKPHVEDSAVYFGNLRLGRGINKNCPRSMFFGSCPKNKNSPLLSQESKTDESDDQKIIANHSADLDLTTDDDDELAHPLQPLNIKTSTLSTKRFLSLDNLNSLSPTGYYSDPCQLKGTSWPQYLHPNPVDIGKSFDELHKGDLPQQSLVEMYRTISNKQDNLSKELPTVEMVLASNHLESAIDSEMAPSKSGPVPNFKSLQERQVTWMMHQLEEQHLKTMKLQYEHHQRNIQKIQEDMEAEILSQQASFQQKIKTSKNALMKEASRHNSKPHLTLYPKMRHANFNSYDADIDLSDTEDSDDNLSQQEVMSSNERGLYVMPPTDNLRADTSQGDSKLSPGSTRSRSFSQSTDHSSLAPRIPSPLDPELITNGRILQGGVYATPFPLSKNTLLLKSPTLTEISSKPESLDTDPNYQSVLGDDYKSEAALLQELEQRHNQRMQQQQQLSTGRNFDQLTADQLVDSLGLLTINDPRGNLREKHAKHLSDLRLYYEKEITELREALSNTDSVSSQSGYKKLVEENLILTKKCQEKEDELAQQQAQDYEQQMHAYQSKLKTYAQRCTDLEKLLNDFKHQLYQETAQNHRKEARLKELESEHLKQNSAIDDLIKLRDEYLGENKQKQATIQKLVSRYEKLEKEYNIMKESLTIAEERYFDANAEILYVKRENARLDFDNKRLMRENENLRQKVGSFKFFRDQETESLNNASMNNSRLKSPRGSLRNLSTQTRQAELELMKEVGGKEMSEAFENKFTSPIMAAERELRKLRSSKKLSALGGGKTTNSITDIDHPDGILVDLPLSISTKSKTKSNQRQLTKDIKSKSNASTSHHSGMDPPSKLGGKNKVPFQAKEVNNSSRYDIRLNDVSNSLVKDQQVASLHLDKSNNTGSAEKSMESRLSQIRSQPDFEDLYSSLTKVQNQLETSPVSVPKTQQKFQVTLETIKKLEDRYDGLQAEKIQLESALSRIPVSGRVDRKARQRKEDLEEKLDTIERELGSVRMSLKRFNVLKSSI